MQLNHWFGKQRKWRPMMRSLFNGISVAHEGNRNRAQGDSPHVSFTLCNQ